MLIETVIESFTKMNNKLIVLDAGPLGMLSNPDPNIEIIYWAKKLSGLGCILLVAAISDYEIRRNLILENKSKSLMRLDALREVFCYLPLTDEALQIAAKLWAESNQKGIPTASPKDLNCDVILAAQALEIGAIVATTNVKHISRFVPAIHWKDIKD